MTPPGNYATTHVHVFRFLISLVGFALITTLGCATGSEYAPSSGGYTVATWRGEWRDASRSRTIPVKIYYPDRAGALRFPVIIFSHGLGGSRDHYSYLGQYWAAHGYVSVHVQHPGSDSAVISRTLRPLKRLGEAVTNPENFINRPLDIRFAIDELTRRSADDTFPLHGRMLLDRVAVAGHSFGAYTVMAVAGQGIGPNRSLHYYGPDPRIVAGLAMSSSLAQTANLDDAYSRVTIPIFHMTGTKDQVGRGQNLPLDAIVGNTTPEQRRVAYDHTQHAPAYLLIFQDGDHRVFSGRSRNRKADKADGEHDEAYQKIICEASTAFWDAALKKDPAAERWLVNGGLADALSKAGTFEYKNP